MRYTLTFALLLSPLMSSKGQAFPEIGRDLPPAPLRAAFDSTYDFKGIVALSNCSGSLVRFDDSKASDKALVLTNGHCTGMIDPGTVRYRQKNNRTFDLLGEGGRRIGKVTATQLAYATMTKTDLAIYQLKESYEQIFATSEVEALTLARNQPSVDTQIEIISGYWKLGYSCSIEAISSGLQEGQWMFEQSMRYSRPGCDVKGGTSGSPVIEAGTRTVIAINNSGNQGGLKCKVNNPCEINADGSIVYRKGYNYAQQVYWLYSCRDASGDFDLSVDGCLLPKNPL